jgi:predicted permease
MRALLRRLWYLVSRHRFDLDLAEELEFHRAMKQRALEADGAAPLDAAFETRRALGSVALAHDRALDVWHPRWLQGVGQDFRFAVRALRTTPVITTVAALSLAFGMGANTAIFSLVNSLILRSLPVAAPERLALMSTASVTTYRPAYTYATFDQIRQRHLFDGVGAYTTCCSQSTITIAGATESVFRQFFSGDFFETLGVHAHLGRLLAPADDVTGGGPDGQVVVISHRLWQRRFDGAPGIIGRPLKIDHASLTIIGVLPPDFLGMEVGRAFDIALPLHTALEVADFKTPYDVDGLVLNVLVRRWPRQTLDAAAAALRVIQPGLRANAMPKQFNPGFLKDPLTLESMVAGTSALRQRFERPLLLVLAVTTLVLLIACANIANLLLARCTARRRELSVRVALGASRWRVARQLLVESALLSAIGTTGGLLFAPAAARLLIAQLSTSSTPVVLHVVLDWRVCAFTAALMVVTALLFGVVPALRATQVAPMHAMKDRVAGGDGRRHAGVGDVTHGLIVAQMALSLMLVVAAGLFVRTFEQLAKVSLGFDRDRVLGVTANAQAIPPADRNELYHRLVRAVQEVPGVARAGGSINPPLAGFLVGDFVVSAPGTAPSPDAERISQSDFVTPGSFAAYGIAIRAGRDVDERDIEHAQPVMLVNEAFARRFFPNRDVVGTTLVMTARLPPAGDFSLGPKTIVGVVGDAVYHSIRDRPRPTVYMPLRQLGMLPHVNFFMAVRSTGAPPASLERSIAAALMAVNPNLTLTFRPLADQVDGALAQDRLVAMLSGFFGVLALVLAGLGLYGVTSYAVTRRQAELGIRMALGARPAGIMLLVMSRVAVLVAAGVIVGTGISLWVSTFVGALLYGLEPRDPVTLVGAAAVLVVVAGCAAGVPTWRASRIDPATTLRCQ